MPKSFRVLSVDQRSDEWRQARVGRLTGSRAHSAQALRKDGSEAAARRDLRTKLVLERITGQPQDEEFESADMARGVLLEPEARRLYEARYGVEAVGCGFLGHPDLYAGCSPDGVVADFAGLIEIKCPRAAIHLDYLRSREVPPQYLTQCQHNLWITGAEWCDFVSYCPKFPPAQRLYVSRVTLDEKQDRAYELLVRMFLAEVDKEEAQVRSLECHSSVATNPPASF